MRMTKQSLSLFFGLVSLSCFFWAARERIEIGANSQSTGQLNFDGESRSFGTLNVGDEAVVHFAIANTSQRDLHILGSDAVCYQAACLEPRNLPLTIKPGQTRLIEVKVLARIPGEFSKQIKVYTDCDVRREILFGVGGSIVEPVAGESSSHDSPRSFPHFRGNRT